MRLQQLASILFLGLATLSSCKPIDIARGLEARGPTKAPSCKKATMFHRVSGPKPGNKTPPKNVVSSGSKFKKKRSDVFEPETSNVDDTEHISTISKRAIVTLEMNGEAEYVSLTEAGDKLHANSLGGASVVAIFSQTWAVGVEVTQGTLGKNDQAQTAKVAMTKLLSEYHSKKDESQVKVLVFAAAVGDTLAVDEFHAAFTLARIENKVTWVAYNYKAFCKYPNPLTQAVLDISWVGAGLWPEVTAAGQCLPMKEIEER